MERVPFFQLQRQYRSLGPIAFKNLQQHYGDIVSMNVPIVGTQYYLFHPDDVYTVLVKQGDDFGKSKFIRRTTRGSFGNGLFMSEGETWKKQRKLMQPHFHHVHIKHYAERMTHHANQLAARWADGTTYNIDAEMHALAFNIVVDVLFSADASDTTDQIASAMHDLGEGLAAQGQSVILALMPDWMPHPILQQKRRGEKLLDKMVQQMIAERRAIGEDNAPHDLLSMLVFSRDEDTGETMSDQQIHDELVTMYIAGHETTALLMGWIWAMLSKHPAAEAKLHAELDSVLGGKVPTVEDIGRLTYLNWIVKETLRLYPPAWFIIRETATDVTLRDNRLRAGRLCQIMPFVTHRDARWFDNPEAFIPERWDNDLEKSLPKGAYMPFGLGARTCIGNGLALLEAQLVLATLTQQFCVRLLDEPQITKSGLTLAFELPVQVRVQRR